MYNQQQDAHQNHWGTQQEQQQSFEEFMRQNDPNGGSNQGRDSLFGRAAESAPREMARTSFQRETVSPVGPPRNIYDPSTSTDEPPTVFDPPTSSKPPPGVGMGIMDGDESSSTSSDQKPPAVQMQVVGIGIDEPTMQAPYQSMIQHQSREEEEARQRASGFPVTEISHPVPLPTPYSAPPQPPNQLPVEPKIPHARLGRRCLTHKPKREPELVKGLVVSGARANRTRTQIQVSCAKCGAALQISKNAIAVSCPGCYKISPASSCLVISR